MKCKIHGEKLSPEKYVECKELRSARRQGCSKGRKTNKATKELTAWARKHESDMNDKKDNGKLPHRSVVVRGTCETCLEKEAEEHEINRMISRQQEGAHFDPPMTRDSGQGSDERGSKEYDQKEVMQEEHLPFAIPADSFWSTAHSTHASGRKSSKHSVVGLFATNLMQGRKHPTAPPQSSSDRARPTVGSAHRSGRKIGKDSSKDYRQLKDAQMDCRPLPTRDSAGRKTPTTPSTGNKGHKSSKHIPNEHISREKVQVKRDPVTWLPISTDRERSIPCSTHHKSRKSSKTSSTDYLPEEDVPEQIYAADPISPPRGRASSTARSTHSSHHESSKHSSRGRNPVIDNLVHEKHAPSYQASSRSPSIARSIRSTMSTRAARETPSRQRSLSPKPGFSATDFVAAYFEKIAEGNGRYNTKNPRVEAETNQDESGGPEGGELYEDEASNGDASDGEASDGGESGPQDDASDTSYE